MKSFISTPIRCSLVLLVIALLVSGCSSSSDSNLGESQADDNLSGTQADSSDGIDESTTGSGMESASDAEGLSTTRVDFNITVPVYSSNALQVRLTWGDIDTTAMWNSDELWSVSADFPANTENQLVVTFSDDNGAITLGSFERLFRTGASPSESFQIAADEFDTDRWDSDDNGISNLQEAIAASLPQSGLLPGVFEANLELVPDKTFRLSWQSATGAQFYRVLENPDGISGFTDVSGDQNAATMRYDHRVALYTRLDASYIVQACNEQMCVDSQQLLAPNSVAQAVGYFKASDAEERDYFGSDVALSADGNTMAVARNGPLGSSGSRNARVYVFGRVDGEWRQEAILGPSQQTPFYFGQTLDFSANGNLLVIGSPGDALFDDPDDPESGFERSAGAVYVFQRESGNWQEQVRLVSNTISGIDELGHSVSISNDGRTIAAGAPGERDDSNCCGAVFIFELVAGNWQQQNQLFAPILNSYSSFGAVVSLSGDGTTLAVGDKRDAHVFVRIDTGWEQEAVLMPDDSAAGSFFGGSMSLDADGNVLAVGAPQWVSSANSPGPIGATYVFSKAAGDWQQQVRLNTSWAGDYNGADVELSGDGSTLAVNSPGAPFVTLYKSDGVNWLQHLRFNGEITRPENEAPTALDSSGRPIVATDASFATSISLSSDGETLAVGVAQDDSASREINGDRNDDSRYNSGAVYLF